MFKEHYGVAGSPPGRKLTSLLLLDLDERPSSGVSSFLAPEPFLIDADTAMAYHRNAATHFAVAIGLPIPEREAECHRRKISSLTL
jgi:hypothetical protein